MTPKKVQDFLKTKVPGLEFKEMPWWLTKLWWADAFIWLKTVYIRPGLEDDGLIRLSVHDAVHVDDKIDMGELKWKWRFMFSEDWRLWIESRGYGVALWIAEQQGYTRKTMLDAYVTLLADKYKISFPRRIIDLEVRFGARFADMRIPGNLIGDFAIWWDEQEDK